MTMKVRALWVPVVLAATMWLAGCGHFTCKAGFGDTTCGSGSGSQKGGGGGVASAYLFVADAGGIQGEVLDATAGTIKITPNFGNVSVPTAVPGDWMAVAQAKYMYTAYTALGDIYGWSISGGDLTGITSTDPFSAAYLANATGGSQAMITNPAGTLLFVSDSANEQVHVYQIGTDGSLTLASSVTITGFTPYNLATDGHGAYLFVSNVVGLATTEVAVYGIGSTGTLTSLGQVPMNLQQMQGDPTGQFMIGTTGRVSGGNLLYVVSLANISTTGNLTVTSFITTGMPERVVVQPNTGGNLVYAFDTPGTGGNGTIEGFQLGTSGSLTGIAGITASGGTGAFDPTGKYLFVTESSNGVASALDAYDVSASSALTTPLANVGWAPGAWAAVDVP